MEYEQVESTEATEGTADERIRRQKRAMYACFTVFVATKLAVVCWILTMSFPYDAFSRLLRGEWWGDDQD